MLCIFLRDYYFLERIIICYLYFWGVIIIVIYFFGKLLFLDRGISDILFLENLNWCFLLEYFIFDFFYFNIVSGILYYVNVMLYCFFLLFRLFCLKILYICLNFRMDRGIFCIMF